MKVVKNMGKLDMVETLKYNDTLREVLSAIAAGVIGFAFIILLMAITND